MSFAKRLLEKQEEQRSAAIGIAIAANVLRRCRYHEEMLLLTRAQDDSYAYRVGNAKLSRGDFGDLFASPREITDAVQAIIDEIALTDCPRCGDD